MMCSVAQLNTLLENGLTLSHCQLATSAPVAMGPSPLPAGAIARLSDAYVACDAASITGFEMR